MTRREERGTRRPGETGRWRDRAGEISADGSTVAWVRTNAPAQTRFLPGEVAKREPGLLPVAALAGTRRSHPARHRDRRPRRPGMPRRRRSESANRTATGPATGPSASRRRACASIAARPRRSAKTAIPSPSSPAPRCVRTSPRRSGLDVFLTSMAPGVTRKAGTRELTLGVNSGTQGSTPSIESLALSPDGSTIAFTSPRDSFVLPEPQPDRQPSVRCRPPATCTSSIWRADTLERAVVDYEGGDPERVGVGRPDAHPGRLDRRLRLRRQQPDLRRRQRRPRRFHRDAPDPRRHRRAAGRGQLRLGWLLPDRRLLTRTRCHRQAREGRRRDPARGDARPRQADGQGPRRDPQGNARKEGKEGPRERRPRARGKAKPKKKKAPPPVLLASGTATARSEGTTTLTLHSPPSTSRTFSAPASSKPTSRSTSRPPPRPKRSRTKSPRRSSAPRRRRSPPGRGRARGRRAEAFRLSCRYESYPGD